MEHLHIHLMSKKKISKKHIRSYKQKPARGRKVFWWAFFIFLGIILFIFLSGNRSLIQLYILHQKRNHLVKQQEELIEQNRQLRDEIDKLQKDDEYIEKLAREKYNMKKEGEEVYIIDSK